MIGDGGGVAWRKNEGNMELLRIPKSLRRRA
jgi:hypothetical protein